VPLYQVKLGEKLYTNIADDGSNFTLLIFQVQRFNFSASPGKISFISPETTLIDSYGEVSLISKDGGMSKSSDKLYFTDKVLFAFLFLVL
jgi:hypothetical protein